MKASQKEIYDNYIEYFLIIHKLGKGIMLKPQLIQYISRLYGVSLSTVNRTLKQLEEVKLIRVMRTRTVTIIGLTTPSLALLLNKNDRKVSVTTIYTNNNLTQSARKNEYIINNLLPSSNNLEHLLVMLDNTNLVSNIGDNAHILTELLKRKHEFKGSMGSSIETIKKEYEYVDTIYKNKQAQLNKGNDDDKKDKKDKKLTINNLQARHLYFKSLGEVKKEAEGTHGAPLEMVYMEMGDLLTYKKVKRDLEVLNKWVNTTLVVANKVNVCVVVESNRVEAIADTLNDWKRKGNFDKPITFNVVPTNVKEKYYKGLTVVL